MYSYLWEGKRNSSAKHIEWVRSSPGDWASMFNPQMSWDYTKAVKENLCSHHLVRELHVSAAYFKKGKERSSCLSQLINSKHCLCVVKQLSRMHNILTYLVLTWENLWHDHGSKNYLLFVFILISFLPTRLPLVFPVHLTLTQSL